MQSQHQETHLERHRHGFLGRQQCLRQSNIQSCLHGGSRLKAQLGASHEQQQKLSILQQLSPQWSLLLAIGIRKQWMVSFRQLPRTVGGSQNCLSRDLLRYRHQTPQRKRHEIILPGVLDGRLLLHQNSGVFHRQHHYRSHLDLLLQGCPRQVHQTGRQGGYSQHQIRVLNQFQQNYKSVIQH